MAPHESPDSIAALTDLGISGQQLDRFAKYRDLILEAASRFNLTAVRDPGEIERRHFVEAVALGRELVRLGAMPADGECRAIDVGTGAGLPGIPIKIAWPAMRLTLLESNSKRCQFLREAVEALGLEGTEVLEGRAETWARDRAHRHSYDLVLTRAVAPLPVLLEYTLPFLRAGGWLAAPKGSAAAREIAESEGALRALGGEIAHAAPFQPPGGRPQTLVLVRQVRPSPERYPRRPGVPAKRPLS